MRTYNTAVPRAIIAVVALISWSVISEVLKIRIPGRHCNGIDMVGNIIGVGIGVVTITIPAMM